MKRKRMLSLLIAIAALLSLVTAALAGGWSLVTVRDFPDFAVAGKPLNMTFTAWVPSLEPLSNLHPTVRATNAKGLTVRAVANAGIAMGDFTATLTLPEPGDWVIAFDTEYKDAATMPPLKVIASGAPKPSPSSLAAQGLRLFTTKGCNGCHLHPRVKAGRSYGPDLTDKRFSAEYLQRFLADPSIAPEPGVICSGGSCGEPYAMPNLGLRNSEIDALVAFLMER